MNYIAVSSAGESLSRIENRVRKGGHDIPAEYVKRRFEDLLKILPYCDEAFFYDNENGFIRAAKYFGGEPELIGEYTPDWILTLKKFLEVKI